MASSKCGFIYSRSKLLKIPHAFPIFFAVQKKFFFQCPFTTQKRTKSTIFIVTIFLFYLSSAKIKKPISKFLKVITMKLENSFEGRRIFFSFLLMTSRWVASFLCYFVFFFLNLKFKFLCCLTRLQTHVFILGNVLKFCPILGPYLHTSGVFLV